MYALRMIAVALVLATARGQPTSECYAPQETSCSAKLASRERSVIIDKVESAKEAIVLRLEELERSMSAIAPELGDVKTQNTAIQRKLSDYASGFETIESQSSDIRQEQRCSSPEIMFRQNGNHLYMLGLSRLNWAQARERCHQCGYRLARIESYGEQQYIEKWLTDIDADELANPGEDCIWIDGTDQSHEGCWVWTYPSVSLFTSGFTAWRFLQPDNYQRNEHCNCLWVPDEWKWNDIDCHIKLTYLCKKVTGEAVTALPSLDEIKRTNVC